MKIKENGTIKLEKNDTRIGNFVLTIEENHVKVQDINQCFSLRFLKRMPTGIWLENLAQQGEEGRDSIKTYIAVMWSVLSVAPDNEYMKDLITAAQEGLARHPEWYGYDKDADDDEAIQEVKEMKEFEEKIRNLEADGQENENPADKQAD